MAGYARQSTADITASAVVKAAPLNAEFNEILAAFAFSGGHNHDGTSTEGAYVGLIADVDALNKVVVDTSNNRVGFFSEVSSAAVEQIRVQNNAIIPVSTGSGTVDLGSSSAEFKDLYIDGTAHIDTLDVDGDATIDDDLSLVSDAAVLNFGADSEVSLTHVADTGLLLNSTRQLQFGDSGTYIHQSADGVLDLVSDTEIEINATTIDINGAVDISGNITIGGTLTIGSAGISEAELEILDGATATTAELNILDGNTSATSTTVADADRVVMNDNGTMAQVAVTDLAAYFDDEITAMPNLTSVGTLTTLTVDNVIVNGTTIGHTDDTDLITLADGVATVAGEISVTTLDIGGTNVTSTAAELNILDGVTSTATELNYLDITTLGTSQASKAVTVDSNGDLVVPDSDKFKFGTGSDMQLYHDCSDSYITNATGALKLATETSGIAVTIGHSTSEVTIADNLTVTGNLTVS